MHRHLSLRRTWPRDTRAPAQREAHPRRGRPAEGRAATERFRAVAAAQDAGYALDSECVAEPGIGGMGFHAFNEKLMADGKLNPRRPEILVSAARLLTPAAARPVAAAVGRRQHAERTVRGRGDA